jgi:hypothetical protein
MKRILLSSIIALAMSVSAQAQDNSYPALAQSFSQSLPTGSARMIGLGGNYSTLGGDISNAWGNPAGLGFYKRSEFSFSPAYQSNQNTSTYLDQKSDDSKGNFNIGHFGLVLGGGNQNKWSGWRSGSFAVSYSRQNTYHDMVSFGGRNQRSSITDNFADIANKEGAKPADFDSDFAQNGTNFDYPTSMFYYGYLINPNSTGKYIGAETDKFPDQKFTSSLKGSSSQWSFAYGASYKDKLYLGAALGITSLSYESVKNAQESFATGVEIKGFNYQNNIQINGKGINLSAGFIYRPNNTLRLGGSITTPTGYTFTETSSASLLVDVNRIDVTTETATYLNGLRAKGYSTIAASGKTYITSIPRLNVVPYESTYNLSTPWKLSGGAALFFGTKGFISGDIEYVAYRGMKWSSTDSYADPDLGNGGYNQDIRALYQDVLNFKVGGEYKEGPYHVRGGIAYYASPLNINDGINRSRLIYSGGVGYRNNDWFFDIAGTFSQTDRAYAPYTLDNSSDFASAKITTQNIKVVASFGVFF